MTDPLLNFVASLGPRPGDTLDSVAARLDRAINAIEQSNAERIAEQMTEEQLQRVIEAAGRTP